MRLLEFVACGRSSVRAENEPESPRRTEESASLSPLTCASPEKKRRRGFGGGAAAWRPSLGAISEDGLATAPTKEKAAAKGGDRSTGRSRKGRVGTVGSTARVLPPADKEFRHFGVATVVPAFAPTVFFF